MLGLLDRPRGRPAVAAAVVALAALLVVAPQLAAQTPPAADVSITAGLKLWYASWKSDTGVATMSSDSQILWGQTASLRVGRFTFGANLFDSTGDFSARTTHEASGEALTWIGDRTDLDLYVSYSVAPYFRPVIGYKSVSSNMSFAVPSGFSTSGAVRLSGPSVGAALAIPLGSRPMLVSGSLTYSRLKAHLRGSAGFVENAEAADTENAYAAEVGFAYSLRPALIVAGYRYQHFKAEGSDSEGDRFAGATLTLVYTLGPP
ncbi:MAG: hypothetical protein HYV63_33775 [Candidatus Schekmanbacteria bacterium]|nr:hypothetical protein [Candidatus Schekmanbacteria bacterium]